MINVFIADDHAILRKGVIQLLATTSDITVSTEAANGQELIALLPSAEADVLILDLDMPGISGTGLIRIIQKLQRDLPILVLSMHDEVQIVMRALQAGVYGYVVKDSAPETLMTAIREIAAGRRYIDPALDHKIAAHVVGNPVSGLGRLSARELQILQMLTQGHSLTEIAKRLHLSPKTVSTHKMRMMKKLDLNNTTELIRYAIHTGMILT